MIYKLDSSVCYDQEVNIDQQFIVFNADKTVQDYFREYLLALRQFDLEPQLLLMLMRITTFIKNEKSLTPILPNSMENFLLRLFKSSQETKILTLLCKLLNFLTKDDSICKRFTDINFHEYLIDKLLKNEFSPEYSIDLSFTIIHLSDSLFSQNNNIQFICNFFSTYTISSFMEARIDIIDKTNFLIYFSKYALVPEISLEIIFNMSKIPLTQQTVSQAAWIMYYITKSNIDSACFLFSHPKISSENLNLFYSVSFYLGNKNVDESFYIPYLSFCIESLRHLHDQPTIQKIISFNIPDKIRANFDLHSSNSACKELFIKYLTILLEFQKEILNDDMILDVINLNKNSSLSVMKQVLIFSTKVIPLSSAELIRKIYQNDFFLKCLGLINSNFNIILVSKVIFLIYEKIEQIPEFLDEFLEIHYENNSIEDFNVALSQIPNQNDQNIRFMIDYWSKLENAISSKVDL